MSIWFDKIVFVSPTTIEHICNSPFLLEKMMSQDVSPFHLFKLPSSRSEVVFCLFVL